MGGADTDLKIPEHIGFIMDGNRRWAKKKGQPAIFGHKKGSETLEKLIHSLGEVGVKYATFFAFSSENWNRTKEEVDGLMLLFLEKLTEKASVMHELGAKVLVIGKKGDFSVEIQSQIEKLEALTSENNKIIINFAFSYGGRSEIVEITKKIITAGLKPEEVTEAKFSEYIYESGQPDPELIIRTGGEHRLSGFMLWQSTYAELYFTDTLWPDFNKDELMNALAWYNDIKRNFGK